MNKRWIFLWFLCFSLQAFSNENYNFENSYTQKSASYNSQKGKFAQKKDEYLFSVGLHGGMSFMGNASITNPIFSGINFEFERVLNRQWGFGFKISPSVHLNTSSESDLFLGPVENNVVLKYIQTYDYGSFYSMPFLITSKYYFPIFSVRSYAGVDAGIILLSGSINGSKFMNTLEKSSSIYTTFGVSPRLGMMFNIFENAYFSFDVYCSYATGAEISGTELVDVEIATVSNISLFRPITSVYTKRLSPSISAGAQVKFIISF